MVFSYKKGMYVAMLQSSHSRVCVFNICDLRLVGAGDTSDTQSCIVVGQVGQIDVAIDGQIGHKTINR